MRDLEQVVQERASTLGLLGSYLKGCLVLNKLPRDFCDYSFVEQTKMVYLLRKKDIFEGVAVSVLCCKCVIQSKMSDQQILVVIDSGIAKLPTIMKYRNVSGKRKRLLECSTVSKYNFDQLIKKGKNKIEYFSTDNLEVVERVGTEEMLYDKENNMLFVSQNWRSPSIDDEKKDKRYRIKRYPAAELKSNIWLTELWETFKNKYKHLAAVFRKLSVYTTGFTNDQMCACILFSVSIQRNVHDPVSLAIRCVRDPNGCKIVSTVLKSLGANGSLLGAKFCETVSLQGMPERFPDLKEAMKKRTSGKGDTIRVNDDLLRHCINKLIHDELDMDRLCFKDEDSFWNSRWAWCVNGSHSRILERHEEVWRVNRSGQLGRRSALKSYNENMLRKFSGRVYVSASIKPEIGKPGRAIQACDTGSYIAFEHLLRPVENAWLNKRVLIDPGSKGHVQLARELRQSKGVLNLMMDFDSFDEQHSIAAQMMVIEELIKVTNYDVELGAKLVKSFQHMEIFVQGKSVGYAKHSLMSGHRATMFINTILNAAYLMSAALDEWDGYTSLHTGDDVYINCDSYRTADNIFRGLDEMGAKMNPMKQSIGEITKEFLRMAVSDRHSSGYISRSIGRAISGNWDSLKTMNQRESLMNWLSTGRTLINRSRVSNITDLLINSMNRQTGIKKSICRKLLKQEIAIEGGPLYDGNTGMWRGYPIHEKKIKNCIKKERNKVRNYAAQDYLTYYMNGLERYAIKKLVLNPLREMSRADEVIEAGLSGEYVAGANMVIGRMVQRATCGSLIMDLNQSFENFTVGMLSKFPVLSLLKNQIGDTGTRDLLVELGYTKPDYYEVAWGEARTGVVIDGVMPYSEAAALCAKHKGKIVKVVTPCYM